MKYGPALDAADRAFICKEMTRELAARKGYCITYMGRPSAVLVGSGLHVNFSLLPLKGGANVFDDPKAEHGFSSLARQCLGGLIAHHEASVAMSAPTVNSYKRLIPGHHRRLLGELGSRQPHAAPIAFRASVARRRASRTACRADQRTRISQPL